MSAPLGAGSYCVRSSLSGVKIWDVKNEPIGSPLTFSMTRPMIRKPVLLYDQRERGSKSSGRVA